MRNYLSHFSHTKELPLLLFLLVTTLLSGCSSSGEGADPGILDSPIAYVKRIIPVDNAGNPIQADIRDPLLFMSGGDLYLKDRASASATEINVTLPVTGGTGDVKDVAASYDGTKLVFSLRLDDPDPNDNIFFTWNIYEYDIPTNQLTRIIGPDITADDGDDIAPYYLPDGRIVFSSDRQTQSKAILLDEGLVGLNKPQFSSVNEDMGTKSLVLHVIDPDDPSGNTINQISYNQSHDLDPVVLNDGRILFSRWDNTGNNNSIHLYTVSPDGSNLQAYYGSHAQSHLDTAGNTIQFTQPQELVNGTIVSLVLPFTNTFGGGDIVIIDGVNYIDIDQPTTINQGILVGPAHVDATVTNVINDGTISPSGRYGSATTLPDGSNRLLVSKGACQLEITIGTPPAVTTTVTNPCVEPYLSDPTMVELPPSYGIWMLDMGAGTEKPIVIAEPGIIITDAIPVQPRTFPPVIFDKAGSALNSTWVSEGVGVLNIRSVYDFGDTLFTGCFFNECTTITGLSNVQELGDPAITDTADTSDNRPARFLRIVKAVGIPDDNDDRLMNPPDLANTAFGRNRNLGMREIIGYTRIEPDGSVRIKVPADVAFSIEILDKYARRIGPRHDNWLQVQPGDTLNCNGCHAHVNGTAPLPHGRDSAMTSSINAGAPFDGYTFPNTQIPTTTGSYFGNFQETMAEARTRLVVNSFTPVVDVIFDDVWSDPLMPMVMLDTSFSYEYTGFNGLTTPSPATASCSTGWTGTCRSVINYQQHIDPIWNVDRGPDTCISCHASSDVNGDRIPDGQLDLTNIISDEEADHIESYRDLLFDDNGVTLDAMGNLVDATITVPVLDGNGNPILDAMGNPVTQDIPDPAAASPASMNVNGARVSYFMEKMTETEIDANRTLLPATVDHSTFLTPAELRLISEWLDIGAQYFNNPFDPAAPMN